MKRTVMFALVATTLSLFGCRAASEPPREPPRAAALEVAVTSEASEALGASPQRPTCTAAGGTCRKSACRSGEVLSQLDCGTERACCLPVP